MNLISKIQIYIRALRLPFIVVSVLPFLFGALASGDSFVLCPFLLGLAGVVSSHLSANLLNDYADSKSNADWQDKNFYGLFGGSKLIQEKILSEKWYFNGFLFFGAVAFLSVVFLSVYIESYLCFFMYLLILALYFSYSHPPLKFSYRKMGEVIIFLLFGPALVMGGYFIQTGVFPDAKSLLISLPFGFLTTATLFCNEIPDYNEDKKAGKITGVAYFGKKKAFIGYFILEGLVFLSLVINLWIGYFNGFILLSFIFFPLVLRAAYVLAFYYNSKKKVLEASVYSILIHVFISVVLILDLLYFY